jgi:hypothetical protein
MTVTVAVQLQLAATHDFEERVSDVPARITAHPVVKPVALPIALPDNGALDEETLVTCLEHQMFDAVALLRCPTYFTHSLASLWIGAVGTGSQVSAYEAARAGLLS